MSDEKDENPCLSQLTPDEWYKLQFLVAHQVKQKLVGQEQDM
jgi:hypothetical protein